MSSRTLGIIKPDAIAAGHAGAILAQLQAGGFTLRAARLARLARAEAEAFYEVHRGRPFYDELVAFMEAADESKRQGGGPVTLDSVLAKAREAAAKRLNGELE